MRHLLLLLLMFCAQAFAGEISGEWEYDGFFYRGHRYPKPDPELSVVFTFTPDQLHRLYWKRADEKGFCERKGTWEVKDQILEQTVTWLNPLNDSTCGSDPDMQLGKTTQNKFTIEGDQLNLYFFLDDQPFIYILRRIGH